MAEVSAGWNGAGGCGFGSDMAGAAPEFCGVCIRGTGLGVLYLYHQCAGGGHEFREVRPDREEIAPLLELLEPGSLRLKGRFRSIAWDAQETLFSLSFSHTEGSDWVEDAGFELCTDGTAYVHRDWLGYLHYRLSGCDMDAVETELLRLLGISQDPLE